MRICVEGFGRFHGIDGVVRVQAGVDLQVLEVAGLGEERHGGAGSCLDVRLHCDPGHERAHGRRGLTEIINERGGALEAESVGVEDGRRFVVNLFVDCQDGDAVLVSVGVVLGEDVFGVAFALVVE